MKKKNKKKMVRARRSLRYLPLRTIEFEDQTKEFEQWLRVFGYANSTIYYSPAYLRSFFYFLEACKVPSISNITNNHVKRYIQVISSKVSRRTDRLLSQNYILNHINSIKLFSKYLIESKGILFDASYRFCRGLNESRTWLVRKEIESLYKACYPGVKGDLNRAILAVYYGLGLRRMEGVGLDFEDIQWNNGMVYVKHAKLKSERYVPMNQKVKQYLEDYETRFRNPLLKKFGRVKESALLISQKGKRISGNAVYSRLQLLAKKANLPQPLSLHTLRHSIATHLLENGLEMESISLFLGHKSLESTQIYTHLIHKV